MKKVVLYFFILAFGLFGCAQPPSFPSEPQLTYIGVNQTEIAQGTAGAERDTLEFTFGFTDGNGDLGFPGDSIDIFLVDSRSGFTEINRLPMIPNEGVANGIQGTLTVRIPNFAQNICCTPPVPSLPNCGVYPDKPFDLLFYTVRIRDRANNFSNEVLTEEITILCQ